MTAKQLPWWLPLTALSAATYVSVTSEMLPAGVLSALSADLGVSESTSGLLVTVWALVIVLSSIPLVRATLRVPRRRLVVLALGALSVGNLLTALAPSYPVAALARAAGAAAHGVFWAVVVAYAASLVTPDRVGRALSIVLAGPSLAGLVGLPLGSAVADVIGWRGVFVLLAGLGLLACLLIVRTVPSDGDTSLTPESSGSWDASALPVLVLAGAGAAALVGHFAAFTFVEPISREVGGLAAGAVPAVLLASGLGGLLGVLFAGRIADRWPGAALPVTITVLALALAGLAAPVGPIGYLGAAVLWGVAIGILPVVLQAEVLRRASEAFRPVAGSVLITVLNLGMGLGAGLGSVLARGADVELLPVLAAGVVLAAVVPVLGLRRRTPNGRQESLPAVQLVDQTAGTASPTTSSSRSSSNEAFLSRSIPGPP